MEYEIKEESKTKLIFTLKGEDHTFCNLLKTELWNDKNVTAASYKIDHPLLGTPRFLIETNGKETPKEALKDAIARLKKSNAEFKKAFAKIK